MLPLIVMRMALPILEDWRRELVLRRSPRQKGCNRSAELSIHVMFVRGMTGAGFVKPCHCGTKTLFCEFWCIIYFFWEHYFFWELLKIIKKLRFNLLKHGSSNYQEPRVFLFPKLNLLGFIKFIRSTYIVPWLQVVCVDLVLIIMFLEAKLRNILCSKHRVGWRHSFFVPIFLQYQRTASRNIFIVNWWW